MELLPSGMSGAQEIEHRVKWGSVVLNGLGAHREPEAQKKEATG